jgi:hypothetical protein
MTINATDVGGYQKYWSASLMMRPFGALAAVARI